jgi:8-amino-7-oxononanoate synthase
MATQHSTQPRVAVDLFEKARTHERVEQLKAAREHDLLPYFRLLEGPAGPVVEMEGAERVMLGSNNYLGPDRRRARQGGGTQGARRSTGLRSPGRGC